MERSTSSQFQKLIPSDSFLLSLPRGCGGTRGALFIPLTYGFCCLCQNSNYILWFSCCQTGVFLLLILYRVAPTSCTLNIRVPRASTVLSKNFSLIKHNPLPRHNKILLNLETGKLKVVKLKESGHLDAFPNCRALFFFLDILRSFLNFWPHSIARGTLFPNSGCKLCPLYWKAES